MHGINNQLLYALIAVIISVMLSSVKVLAEPSPYRACADGVNPTRPLLHWMNNRNDYIKHPPPDHTDIIKNDDGTYSVAGAPLVKLAIVIHPEWAGDRKWEKLDDYMTKMESYYNNSGVAVDFEVACVYQSWDMPYTTSPAYEFVKLKAQTLSRLNEADLVAGLTQGSGGYCGLGALGRPSNYYPLQSVSSGTCPAFTFAHEIGHNLGLHHAHEVNTRYNGRKGFCMPPNAPNAQACNKGTIMSYAGRSRVPFFANKDHTYQGVVLGNEEHTAVEYLNREMTGKALAWELTYGKNVKARGADLYIDNYYELIYD